MRVFTRAPEEDPVGSHATLTTLLRTEIRRGTASAPRHGWMLPFSHDAFLDVFGAYNSALWPAVAALWLTTAWLAVTWILQRSINQRRVFALLAVHWAWSGIAYHWLFFRAINPAATLFAVGFVAQALLFAWLSATSRERAAPVPGLRAALGHTLVAYGLAYPFLGLAFGLDVPRLPLFGVPCPTTLLTAGWLIMLDRSPRFARIIPLLWAGVGASAAVTLDMRADFALIAVAALLAIDAVAPSALGTGTPSDRRRALAG